MNPGKKVDGNAGIQYCRINSPMGVPGPTRQRSSLFSSDSISIPSCFMTGLLRSSTNAAELRPYYFFHKDYLVGAATPGRGSMDGSSAIRGCLCAERTAPGSAR
jgi:hypothetical protein